MKTTTKSFHAIRGHVEEGCIIVAPSGREFTIKNTVNGWMIHDNSDGLAVSGYLPAAVDVERFVVLGLGAR